MVASRWNKFTLLMWKNWLLTWRHKFQSIIEIIIPLGFCAILVLTRSLVLPEHVRDPTIWAPVGLTQISNTFRMVNEHVNFSISFTPPNMLLYQLVNKVVIQLNLESTVKETNAVTLEQGIFVNNYLAGIVFDESYRDIKDLPEKLTYTIRYPAELRLWGFNWNPLTFNWRTDLLFPMFQMNEPRNNYSNYGGAPPGYFREGFLQIQHLIAKTYIEMKSGKESIPDIHLRRFPYPPYIIDVLLRGLESFVSLIILLGFVYPCINLVKFITTEKEKQLKEAMKIMGLSSWLHWTAWFVKSIIFMVIIISLIVMMLKIAWYGTEVSVFTYSHWSTIWILMFVFSITTIMFCFMVSVFFSKANTASALAGLLWFLFYTPYAFTVQNYQSLTFASKILVCFFSNTAMAYAFRLILRFEGTSEGLQWNNMWIPVAPDDDLTFGIIIMMLLADGILYLLIALYIEQINPGDFGVPQKIYFPFTKTFWFGPMILDHLTKIENTSDDSLEPEPIDKYAGIKIKNIRKIYSNKKVAVSGLTLNMYEDHITVLLGHNGAGKTTTMSMLTGMFPPTSGTATINGKDILTDLKGVRSSLGLCPQYNILFDELTVREHIMFFSQLKGLNKTEVNQEVMKYVNLLELQPKIDSPSSTLSGGMQRKLSVGVALCGNSKVVLFDEPTSGMDPAARRALWDLLQKEKKGRTILLSTHFMDEADILGDRIAIMSEGVLKACGSSFFLKKRFGIGYHLIGVKGPNTNVLGINHLLQKYIPGIEYLTNIGSELSYELSEEYINQFEVMFKDLENNSETLGLIGYGVSPTTLEEVFMKVGTDLEKSADDVDKANLNIYDQINPNNDIENGSVVSDSVPLLEGGKLIFNHFIAMLEKKMWYTLNNWVFFLIQVLMPMAFIIITVLIVRAWSAGNDLAPMEISILPYMNTISMLEREFELNVDTRLKYSIANHYENLFHELPYSHQVSVISQDMLDYILELSERYLTRINARYMIGATVMTGSNLTAWFNNQAFHTAPLALNTLHNALAKEIVNETCQITVINRPLPFTAQSRMLMIQAGNNIGFQLAFNTGFALSLVSAFYIVFYIKERVTKAKLLQFVSGANVFIFWLTTFIWDYITFLVTTIFSIGTLAAFQEQGFSTIEELGRVFVIWICFGFCFLPITYLVSMMFTIPSTGFVRYTIYNLFTGLGFFSIVFIMRIPEFDLEYVADGLSWAFLFFPHFALSDGLHKLNRISSSKWVCENFEFDAHNICENHPLCCINNYFQWETPGIGRNVMFMMISGISTTILLILFELQIISALFYKIQRCFEKKNMPQPFLNEVEMDSDVLAERNAINQLTRSETLERNLVLQNVTKYYNNFLAVNQISIGVNHSECFGLLGVNGAGKTTTFKMLTGDESISFGEAFVAGISLKTSMNRVNEFIGYCPQFDALIEDLTGRETLRIYCLLRGVPNKLIKNVSLKLAHDLHFMKHIDKKVKEYSGGNKRKLSTAIALIGNPVIVYLDEPTTGMDPGAKRQLWDMVCKVRNTGKSIVLTSHSMEECEALCTKLAIMVNGEFKCIGSPQYLKNKFSKGYLVTVKIKKSELGADEAEITENIKLIKLFMKDNFAGALLKEEYGGLLTYDIPNIGQKWSHMFGLLQNSRLKLDIEDYSISQTSLEQVFLSFTKYQQDENRPS